MCSIDAAVRNVRLEYFYHGYMWKKIVLSIENVGIYLLNKNKAQMAVSDEILGETGGHRNYSETTRCPVPVTLDETAQINQQNDKARK